VVASLRISLNTQTATSRVVVKIGDIHNSLGKVKIGLWKSEDGFLKK
jgi:uncharacterized protein (DUF2141 family)